MLCHVSVHSGDRAKISVAVFDQIALFSDFNHLFELLEPGFSPYSSSTFYILELSDFNNAYCEFYEQFLCRKLVLLIESLSRMQSFVMKSALDHIHMYFALHK